MIQLQQTWMLPALIAIPFIAGLLCWLVERFNKRLPRWIALIGMILTFGLSVVVWYLGDFSGMSTQVIAPDAAVPWDRSQLHNCAVSAERIVVHGTRDSKN